jgi:signal transduction histidine kinase
VLEERLRAGEVTRAVLRARLLSLALLLSLLIVLLPSGAALAELGPLAYGLFTVQVLLALAALSIELFKVAYARAERAALRRNAFAMLTANEERRRAIEERDELQRTVAGLRSLNEHLQEELRARDDAVASAVHELRTPLTSVSAYGQLMSRNLQAVQRQVEQLERLIGDLLAQPGALPFTLDDVDLALEAHEAARRVRLLADADVDIVSGDDGPHVVHADRGRIGQVLDNLLRNAAKFSPPGKPIEVVVRRSDGNVVLAVTDHGTGIPAQELTLIFERYYRGTGQRRNVPGEGIGLAVCREIVEAHHGKIWATSSGLGRGATFFVSLPTRSVVEVGGEALAKRA